VSCNFFENHFVAGADPAAFEEHRKGCSDCRSTSARLIDLERTFGWLGLPTVPAPTREGWKRIPALTVHCGLASELLADAMEEELPEAEARRLAFHLSRCEACRETAAVLAVRTELRSPDPSPDWTVRPPAPVVSLADARRKRRSRPAAWSDPRLYAAAACFLAGFLAFFVNTVQSTPVASSARSMTGDIENSLRVRWAEAVDRVQIWEAGISRQWVATRETLTGYTRAAGAIALSAAGRATEGFLRNETKTEKGKKS
jgi:hypothetical protein